MAFDKIKNDYKHNLFKQANIRRIHIVGCGRSGTTMLHYSMIAFANTILFDRETSVWNHPSVREARAVCQEYQHKTDETQYYVTKRGVTWWREGNLERLVEYSQRYGIFLIHLVRDPRDVLTSKHPLDKKRYYIEPTNWSEIIQASDRFLKLLEGYPDLISLRYEDVILHPQKVQSELSEKIGLRLRDGISAWDRLKDNVEVAGEGLERMIPYMHKLRNFDPNTVGKWKNNDESAAYVDTLLDQSEIKEDLAAFMERYNY